MIKIHNLGFPRLGEHRELKFALERYWRNELGRDELEKSPPNFANGIGNCKLVRPGFHSSW